MKEIQLTRNMVALVDDEDYEKINNFTWYAEKNSNCWYALHTMNRINGKQRRVLMHRIIMNVNDSNIFIDHKNGNGLDNRKENLRICSQSENGRNRVIAKNNKCGYKGVVKHKQRNLYIAKIGFNGTKYYLGVFKTPEEAAKKYNEAAIKYHGEFAKLNEIKEIDKCDR